MKSWIALSLTAALLVLALPARALAALPSRIEGVHAQFSQMLTYALDGEMLAGEDLLHVEVEPASELRIYLCAEDGAPLFYDQNGSLMQTADITISRLRAAQLSVGIVSEGQMEILESADFACGNDAAFGMAPYVSIRFAREVADETAFSFTVELRMMGQPMAQTAVPISGALKPNYRRIHAEEGVTDVRDGAAVLAQEDIPMAQFLIGDGVSIKTPMLRGDRFYGSAFIELIDPQASPILRQDLSGQECRLPAGWICTLQTAEVDRSHSLVRIQSDNALYIYDAQMRYLGTTNGDLPYSEIYYLFEKMHSFY